GRRSRRGIHTWSLKRLRFSGFLWRRLKLDLSLMRDNRPWILHTVETVRKERVNVNHLGSGMSLELVFQLAYRAHDCGSACVFRDRDSDCFFSASGADEDCG